MSFDWALLAVDGWAFISTYVVFANCFSYAFFFGLIFVLIIPAKSWKLFSVWGWF